MTKRTAARWYTATLFATLALTADIYLVIVHAKSALPVCSLVKGCEAVLTSRYGTLFGLPLATYGAVGFAALVVLVLYGQKQPKLLPWLRLAVLGGALAALALLIIQEFVLHAFCQYCLIIDISTLLVALLLVPELKPVKRNHDASVA